MKNVIKNVSPSDLGKIIQEHRICEGYSKSDFAKITGISISDIENIESGRMSVINFQLFLYLIHCLGYDVDLSTRKGICNGEK